MRYSERHSIVLNVPFKQTRYCIARRLECDIVSQPIYAVFVVHSPHSAIELYVDVRRRKMSLDVELKEPAFNCRSHTAFDYMVSMTLCVYCIGPAAFGVVSNRGG